MIVRENIEALVVNDANEEKPKNNVDYVEDFHCSVNIPLTNHEIISVIINEGYLINIFASFKKYKREYHHLLSSHEQVTLHVAEHLHVYQRPEKEEERVFEFLLVDFVKYY